MEVLIILALCFIAGSAKGFSDKLYQWTTSIWRTLPETHWFYRWANPMKLEIVNGVIQNNGCWKNKWKLNEYGMIIPNTKRLWYYLWIFKPKYIERFPYSSKFLVGLTDAWHFAQSIMLTALFVSLVLYGRQIEIMNENIILDFIIFRLAFGAGFSIFHDELLN